ncbi:hypothetical protein ACGFIO_40540, partial [Actinoplanes sp. NPDC049265]
MAVAAAAVLGIGAVPAPASASPDPGAVREHQGPNRRANFDARTPDAQTLTASRTKRQPAEVVKLHESLGVQGIVDIDPVTGTARRVARLDGFLTGESGKPARDVAVGYLAAYPGVFGQTSALRLRKDYVDVDGTHHLSFVQMVGEVPVFGNGVKADVTRSGQLIQVTGSPAASLPASLGAARLSAAQAREAAARDAGVKAAPRASEPTRLVAFATRGGARLAWQTLSVRDGYLHVIDAVTGRVLYRQ